VSKIGKKPINIPEGVEVKIKTQEIEVSGPKGELALKIPPQIKFEKKQKEDREVIMISMSSQQKALKSLVGLYRSLINNMIEGAEKGFQKQLELSGLGFRATLASTPEGKQKLVLALGYSHPVEVEAPEGISFSITKNIITIEGIDKQLVGETAAKIRALRPPEPYKGKGIRYLKEAIKRKPGKAVIKAPGAA
jgi:large subunit ribosomal protein L6